VSVRAARAIRATMATTQNHLDDLQVQLAQATDDAFVAKRDVETDPEVMRLKAQIERVRRELGAFHPKGSI